MAGKLLNPFEKGVSYLEFQEAVKASKKTVKEYCKGILTKEEIEFVEAELKLIKSK